MNWGSTWSYRVRAVNAYGPSPWATSAGLRLDVTPPVSSSSMDDAWHTSAVSVTVNSTDDKSGVASKEYAVGGGPWLSYAGPFPVPSEGITPVAFRATDAAGNVETAKTGNVKIDVTAPHTGSDLVAVYSGSASIHLAASDALSGVKDTWYRLDGGTPVKATSLTTSAIGTHTLTSWSDDLAGNMETEPTPASFEVRVADLTSPVTTAKVGGAVLDSSAWFKTSVQLTLEAIDPVPSPPLTSYYTLDGGGTQTYSTPVAISGEGAHPVTYWSQDGASNTEVTRSGLVRIDSIAPVTADDRAASYVSAATITLSPTDGGSGVGATRYSLDGGSYMVGTVVHATGIGAHTLSYYTTDVAGNVEAPKSAPFAITAPPDSTAPVTGSDTQTTYASVAAIHLTATDNTGGSGVAHTYYRLDGGTTLEGIVVTTNALGAHTLEFWSVDVAGNAETPHVLASFTVLPGIQPTSVTIKTAATSTYIGKTVRLSGVVTPQR